jgi:hypothetical protein
MTDEPDLTKRQEQILRALMAEKLAADIDPTFRPQGDTQTHRRLSRPDRGDRCRGLRGERPMTEPTSTTCRYCGKPADDQDGMCSVCRAEAACTELTENVTEALETFLDARYSPHNGPACYRKSPAFDENAPEFIEIAAACEQVTAGVKRLIELALGRKGGDVCRPVARLLRPLRGLACLPGMVGGLEVIPYTTGDYKKYVYAQGKRHILRIQEIIMALGGANGSIPRTPMISRTCSTTPCTTCGWRRRLTTTAKPTPRSSGESPGPRHTRPPAPTQKKRGRTKFVNTRTANCPEGNGQTYSRATKLSQSSLITPKIPDCTPTAFAPGQTKAGSFLWEHDRKGLPRTHQRRQKHMYV